MSFSKIKKIIWPALIVLFMLPLAAFAVLSVVTIPAKDITKNSATLWGRVSDVDAVQGDIVDLYGKFRYSNNAGNKTKSCQTMLTPTDIAADPPPLTGLDFFQNPFYNFKKPVPGLETGKKYYYCAIVSSSSDFSANVIYGNVITFTPEDPTDLLDEVVTLGSSGVTESTATITGDVIETNPTVVYGRFRYSENSGLSCASLPSAKVTPTKNSKISLGGTLHMSQLLTGLKDGTTYYYCAMGADNSNFYDALYGEVKTFTTPFSNSTDRIGPVKTLAATQIDDTEATLKGNYTAGGPGFAYFRLSTAEIPPIFCNDIYGSDMIGVTSNIPDPIGYTLGGNFVAHVNGLEPETDYYYCAVVSNGAYNPSAARQLSQSQIKYGEVKKFRTLPCDTCNNTTITTKGSDVLDSTSATLKGYFKSSRAVTVNFEYSKFSIVDPGNPQPSTTSWQPTTEVKYTANSNGNYDFLLKNLEKNTTYSFRAVAKVLNPDDSIEIFYGQTLQFTTNKYDGINGDDGNGNDGNGYPVDTTTTTGGGIVITTGDDNCPAGTTGTFPNCVPVDDNNPADCPPGWLGNPPKCFNPGPGGNGGITKTPKATITVNPAFIDAGESSTVSWTSSAVTSCTLNGYDVPLSGSADTGALQNSTSYTISCSGPNGSATDTDSVFVNIDGNGNGGGDLVWVDVTASPVFFPLNASVTISWSSGGAQFCDSGGHGEGTSGSFVVPFVKNSSSFTVTCSGVSGTDSDTAYIVLNNNTTIPPLPTNQCTPGSQTRLLTCPVGYNGSIDQARTSSCPDPNGSPVWTDWVTTNNTCKDANGNTAPPPPPPPSGACFPGNQTRLLQCPVGYNGSIDQARTSSCPDPNGSPVWTDWVTTNNTCKDANGNILPNPPPGGGLPPGPGNPGVPTGPGGPGQNGNPPLPQDNDNDDDGINNPNDSDTDGDWDPNSTDTDDDGDGIPDFVDGTPNGPGTGDDFDGGGLPNSLDTDMDGDGVPNYLDNDTDGDGIPNDVDLDDDGDGIPDLIDPTPKGPHGDRKSGLLVLGDTATPPNDAIVRYHEGIETVFARQIRRNTIFAERYGYDGGDIVNFAWDLAHTFAKFYFGYINEDNLEVRVSAPDVSAYELRQVANTLVVYEYYKNVIVDIRSKTVEFKAKNPYEYYFRRIFK